MRRYFSTLVLISAGFLPGCGGGESFNRVPVTGTVTLNGDSSRSGSITATADIDSGDKDNKRPTAQTLIENGKFEFTAENGPTAGAYIFEIYLTLPDKNMGGESPEGEDETGGNAETYQKRVTIPGGGSEALSVELTNSDRMRADGSGPMPASGEI